MEDIANYGARDDRMSFSVADFYKMPIPLPDIEEQKKTDLIKRMVKGYNKNRDKIANKPEQPELSQSEKRKRKLADLNSRSNSWKGLESFSDYTGENQ